MFSFTRSCGFNASSFRIVKDSLQQSADLPLAEVIDEEQWQAVFADHGIDFGRAEGSIYTPAIVLWALLSQVFFKGEMRSCKAAVNRVVSFWAVLGKKVCSTNTGAYCRARMKLSFAAIREISQRLALSTEAAYDQQATVARSETEPVHAVVAEVESAPTDGRILLFDGFTITASDTPANQQEFPQNPVQKAGLGFPIIRCVQPDFDGDGDVV